MIDANTLLPTDATVIAGLIILLTIYSIVRIPPHMMRPKRRKTISAVFGTIIAITISPFSLSALCILYGENLQSAIVLASIGFILTIVAVVAITIILFKIPASYYNP